MLCGAKPLFNSRPTRLFALTRHLRQPPFIFTNHDHARSLKTVAHAIAPINIEDFRRDAFQAQKPLLIRPCSKELSTFSAIYQHKNDATTETSTLPALTKWFTTSSTLGKASLTPYLDNFHSTILPYEISNPNSTQVSNFISWLESPSSTNAASSRPAASSNSNLDSDSNSDSHKSRLTLAHLLKTYIAHHPSSSPSSSESEFLILDLPLHLLLLAHQFNNTTLSSSQTTPNPCKPLTNLYIAQAPLSHLPPALQSDLPTPFLVLHAGKGDVYSSSIWLGLQPTYTPWHRDPNPNLFCQLCGTKTVRLMPPRRGEALFRGVMASLMAAGNPKMRGEEMMTGEQRRVLEEAVWGGEGPGPDGEGQDVDEMMYEVTVRAGDMLFMPLGWWHSVKSMGGEDGGINGSVNWWFR